VQLNGKSYHVDCFDVALRKLLEPMTAALINVIVTEVGPPMAPVPAGTRWSGRVSAEFRCPKCGSRRWSGGLRLGTEGDWGFCNGTPRAGVQCPFRWERSEDWRHFYEVGSGAPFASRDDFERRARWS